MITIRRAEKKDIPILLSMNHEVFVDNKQYDDDLLMEWSSSEKGKTYFSELLGDPQKYCLIAEESGHPAGYIACSPKKYGYRKSRYLEIDNMGVNPEFRSQGIGSKLISEVLQWAKSKGYEKLYVNAYFQNKKGVEFYRKNGFGEIDLGMERTI